MSKQIRVGVAGLTHGHVWGLIDSWKKVEGAKLVAVSDHTPLLEKAKPDFENVYTDWREMLEKESLDALLVTSNNRESSQIAIAALGLGIPCLVEKAMAADAKDADAMLAAQKASGKTLMINWPLAWNAWVYELKRQIEAETVGKLFHMRFRIGHSGPREIGCDEYFVGWLYDEYLNGGGAVADFGSYGAVLSRYLFGLPESVFCLKGNYTKDYEVSDDHAIILLRYPTMTVSLEGTWATAAFDSGPNPVIHGSKATLGVANGDINLFSPGKDPHPLEVPPLASKNPAAYFVSCMESGASPEGIRDPELAADACRILDAAIESSKTGCTVKL